MVKEIVRRHWRSLAGLHKPSAWEALDGGYSDARRAYHGWGHIAELLGKLDEFHALTAKPALIATDVFWHDAVYATQGPDGAKRSDLENVRDTRWGALQAVTAYVDHTQPTRQTAGRTHAEARFERATEPQPLKDRALVLLTAGGEAS